MTSNTKASKKKQQEKMVLTIVMLVLILIIVISCTLILLQLLESRPWEAKRVIDDAIDQAVTSDGQTIVIPLDPYQVTTSVPVTDTPEPTEPLTTPDAGSPGTEDPQPTDTAAAASATAKATSKATSKATAKATSNGSTATATPAATDGQTTISPIDINFTTLRAINSDVVAWLYLQDSSINYPVVQESDAHPTGYYLTHMYDQTENIAGSLFIESGFTPFKTRNTIIHGHRMNNGSMFGKLNKYATQSYFDSHPVMQLYTPSQNYLIYVFAAYQDDIAGDYNVTRFDSSSDYQSYLTGCAVRSEVTTGIIPTSDDKIITLVTCVVKDDMQRFIVQGVLVPID